LFKIILENTGKRYNREWIFRNVNLEFNQNNAYAVLGSNGSGKSTFLQTIAGNITSSSGSVRFLNNGEKINEEHFYKHISIASPYLELIEEFTLIEMLKFHSKFKKLVSPLAEIVELSGLAKSEHKQIKYYSSGMKQRVRLILAILSDTPILLLDEPVSNLDKQAVLWYKDLMTKYSGNRITFVCSNHQSDEYFLCKETINIEDYK
jgi:ABC-type multidrug transport system ATPase subunit